MRARYIGNPKRAGEGPEVTSTFGLTFLKGAWVSLDGADPAAIRKLSNNPFFEVDRGKAATGQPTATVAAPPKVESEEIPANWREAHAQTRRKWARQIGADPANVAEADAAIEKHLAAKAADAPAVVDPPGGGDDDWGDLDPQ